MDMEKVWLESIRAIWNRYNVQKENIKIAISYDMKF